MVEFNRLDDTEFPNIDTVDVYQYRNTYDFERFDRVQMRIRVLNVPWDLGTVHVGQSVVTGIGNVVYFENASDRDSWFDSFDYATSAGEFATGAYDGIEFVTDYRKYHSEDKITLPIPFDVMGRFNYIRIDYTMAPDAETPVDFQIDSGIRAWHYFIRNIESKAVNTTVCEIFGDLWTTYIYDMEIPALWLEKGHAALAKTNVDAYLSNPLENSQYLLTEDVNFGELQRVSGTSQVILNADDMLAVIVSTANPQGSFGQPGSNWQTPTGNSLKDGEPAPYAFACAPSNLAGLLYTLDANEPQFKQTVKGVYFIARDLVTTNSSYTLHGIEVWNVSQRSTSKQLMQLSRSLFGYDAKYADLAKLYTYPYAAIEIVSDDGESTLVRIEDTSGTISLQLTSSLVFPYIALDGRLSGIGGATGGSVTFRNVNAHSFSFSGKWYEHLKRWEVPCFAVMQSAATDYNFRSYYDRQQKALELANAQTNSNRSAKAAYDNAIASNATNNENALATNKTSNENALATNKTSNETALATNKTSNENALATNAANAQNSYDSAGAAQRNAYNTNFASAQNSLDANGTAYSNATDSNSTANTNATNANRTAYDNATNTNAVTKENTDRSADTSVTNTETQINANDLVRSYNNSLLSNTTLINAYEQSYNAQQSNRIINATLNDYIVSEQQSQAIGIASNVLGNAATGAAMGAVAGPMGAAVGAVGGVAAGVVSAVTSVAQMQVGINFRTSEANTNTTANTNRANNSNDYNAITNSMGGNGRAGYQYDNNIYVTNAGNSNIRTQTANNAATMKSNARATKSMGDANALRTLNTANTAANATRSTNDSNALRTRNTADSNANRSKQYADMIADRNKTTSDNNTRRTKTTADSNANMTKTTADSNANKTKTTADSNANKTKTTADSNANKTKATGDANALRTYNAALNNATLARQTGESSIQNAIREAALGAPLEYGSVSNGETSVTRPQGLFANVVTQSKAAIAQAGDDFLRHGYAYDGYFEFNGNFNVMPKFSYWKCSELWIKGLNMPDEHVDYIRYLLMGGVTVWKRPEYIGNTTIYQNK